LRGTREAYEFNMNSHRGQNLRKGFTHTCKAEFILKKERDGEGEGEVEKKRQ